MTEIKVGFGLFLLAINGLLLFFKFKIFIVWLIVAGMISTLIHALQNKEVDSKNMLWGAFLTLCFGWFGLPYYIIYYFVWGKDD